MAYQCSTTRPGSFGMCPRDNRKFLGELTKAHPVSGLEIATGFAVKKFAESEISQFDMTIPVEKNILFHSEFDFTVKSLLSHLVSRCIKSTVEMHGFPELIY